MMNKTKHLMGMTRMRHVSEQMMFESKKKRNMFVLHDKTQQFIPMVSQDKEKIQNIIFTMASKLDSG